MLFFHVLSENESEDQLLEKFIQIANNDDNENELKNEFGKLNDEQKQKFYNTLLLHYTEVDLKCSDLIEFVEQAECNDSVRRHIFERKIKYDAFRDLLLGLTQSETEMVEKFSKILENQTEIELKKKYTKLTTEKKQKLLDALYVLRQQRDTFDQNNDKIKVNELIKFIETYTTNSTINGGGVVIQKRIEFKAKPVKPLHNESKLLKSFLKIHNNKTKLKKEYQKLKNKKKKQLYTESQQSYIRNNRDGKSFNIMKFVENVSKNMLEMQDFIWENKMLNSGPGGLNRFFSAYVTENEIKLVTQFFKSFKDEIIRKEKYKILKNEQKQELYEGLRKYHLTEGLTLSNLLKFVRKESSDRVKKNLDKLTNILPFIRSVIWGIKKLHENKSLDSTNLAIYELYTIIKSYNKHQNNAKYKNMNQILDTIIQSCNQKYNKGHRSCEQMEFNKKWFRQFIKHHDVWTSLEDDSMELVAFYIISEKIETLKFKLKSEPFEELQFLLIRYVTFCTNDDEFEPLAVFVSDKNVQFHFAFLHMQKILLCDRLDELNNRLKKILNECKRKTNQNSVPTSEQTETIEQKIKPRHSKDTNYMAMYDDYWLERDTDSLERIRNYLQLAKSIDLNSTHDLGMILLGKLVVERGLQVTGEFLKSSYSSPYLSTQTKEYLNLPIKELVEIRDHLSHGFNLSRKIHIESTEIDVFIAVQNDFKALENTITKVLDVVKLKRSISRWRKVLEFVSLEHITAGTVQIETEIRKLEIDLEEKTRELENINILTRKQGTLEGIMSFRDKMLTKHRANNIETIDLRLKTLENILNFDHCLENEIRKQFPDYDENSKPYDGKYKHVLIEYYKNNEKLQAAVEMLLLDLMSFLNDDPINLQGLANEGFYPRVLGNWRSVSLRNHLAHYSELIGSRSSIPEIIISKVLTFINDKEKIISLVSIIENDDICNIISKTIKNNSKMTGRQNLLDNNIDESDIELWKENEFQNMLTATNEYEIELLNKYKSSIKMIVNTRYYEALLRKCETNNIFFLIKRVDPRSKEIIDILNHDQRINVDGRDESGQTIFYYAVKNSKKDKDFKNVIVSLLEKKASLDQNTIELLQKENDLFNFTLEKTIRKDSVENFEKFYPHLDTCRIHLAVKVACIAGNRRIVSVLLDKGISFDFYPDVNSKVEVPLCYAAQNGHQSIVIDLLKSGVRYDMESSEGKTPLKYVEKKLNSMRKQHDSQVDHHINKEKFNLMINKFEHIENLLNRVEKLFQAVEKGRKDEIHKLLEGTDSETLQAVLCSKNTNNDCTVIEFAKINHQIDIERLLEEKFQLTYSVDQQ